ncbi:MAG: LuxR C-terminal-related transcriptional regulator [Candidatus Lustribacter sp.]|jgi:DNA-binding CsgD family transcriptional regulator
MGRLLEAAEYRIILVTAPAGFGKTTSIKQFLTRCDVPILVSTPPSANTLGHFMHAFANGCRSTIQAMSSPPAELSDQPISPEQELELYSAWAIANLRGVACTIAIDDLQHTDADPRVADFLSRLAEHCGDQIQWLFASRTQGRLPRVRWQAYAEADTTIGADDLRMDQDEAHELARTLGSPVTREQLSRWVDLTQGFPIPLTYAIRASSRRANIDELTAGMRSLTFHYLAEHLWRVLPNDDRTLLELAAFLPPTHVQDFEHFGIPGAIARAGSLSDDIAFVSLDSASKFSMHDLFREFVRQQILVRGLATYQEVARQAATLLIKSERPIEALQILVEIGDTPALLSAIDSSSLQWDNLEITPRLVAATEDEPSRSVNLGALMLHTNYWARRGSATKALHYAEEILERPEATSLHLICAIRTISRFTHFRSAEIQRTWLTRLSAILHRLDKSDSTLALAYQANYCSRFPESIGQAKRLIDTVLNGVDHLDLQNRFDTLMVNVTTFILLDDEDSALKSTREAVSVAEALDDPHAVVKALNTLGSLLYQRCDRGFEEISEKLRQLVVTYGAWRFSLTSHWLPPEYYARSGNAEKSLEASALFNEVILGDDGQRQLALYFRRICTILTNLINAEYSVILANVAQFGLPEYLEGKYEIAIATSLSYSLVGDDDRAAQYLSQASTFREKMTRTWQKSGVFDVYGEIITLCSMGRWTQAKRLMKQQGKNSLGTPVLYNALTLLADGPPFAGVTSALQPFAGKPYVGMLALLANRVVEKWSAPTKERLLTAAEADILRLIGLGKSNKDIASTRSRSIETVKRQVASLYRKLGVESRTSAVAVGRERGLL